MDEFVKSDSLANLSNVAAADRASEAVWVSSKLLLVWANPTGKIAATRMNPIPKIMTANNSSVNEKPVRNVSTGVRKTPLP
jgi:hypothetical protein